MGRKKIRDDAEQYQSNLEAARERGRQRSAAAREIGPPPEVADPARRESCRLDLLNFCKTYFGKTKFRLPFAKYHLETIEIIQQTVLHGGLHSYALPRGGGKTTIAEVAALWATAYGHRKFLVVIGANGELAKLILDSIKAEIEDNDILFQDFPEICYPIRKLERIHNRAHGQMSGGHPTAIEWTDKFVRFPTIEGSVSSGAAIWAAGITGAIRGLKVTSPDGTSIRPDFVLLDDPQDDESANSVTQNMKRERLINGAILKLANPDIEISAVMPCTVIAPGDLVDRLLDPDLNPRWNGRRSKMLLSFPENLELWERYAELRKESFRIHRNGHLATEFYRLNKEEMDRGAKVSWEHRYFKSELSAIQHAMNQYIDDPLSFAAELQNEPRSQLIEMSKTIDPDAVAKRLNGLEPGIVPRECTRLTAFVDIGGQILWYAIVGWNEHFGGSVVTYGAWPRQNRAWFSGQDARPALIDQYPGRNNSQAVFAGLVDLLEQLCGRDYEREGGGAVQLEKILVDCGWGPEGPSVIHDVIRSSRHGGLIFPSKGYGRSVTSLGVNRWRDRPGERRGYHWRITAGGNNKTRIVQFDPDAWKSKIAEDFATPLGSKTGLTIFGKRPELHQLFASHLGSEAATSVTLHGETFDKWSLKPALENHWLDCVVGCAVAASVAGLVLVHDATITEPTGKQATRVSFKQLYEQARRKRQG